MKRFMRNICVLAGAALITLGAVSCQNLISSGEEHESESYNKARLNVTLKDGIRTIVPTDVTERDITKIELFAQAQDSAENVSVKTWETDESENAVKAMSSDSSVYVEAGIYTFTIKLYVTQNETYVLCQTGVIKDKTVEAGNNTLSFASDYVTDSTGNLSITFSFAKKQYIESIEVELLSEDGEEVKQNTEVIYTYNRTNSADDSDLLTASYKKPALESGTYILRYKLYGLEPAAREAYREPINTFEKLVRIASGCNTSTIIDFYDENGTSLVNSLYAVSLVVPADITFNGQTGYSRKAGESFILPSENDFSFAEGTYKTFMGWSLIPAPLSEDEVYDNYVFVEDDTTLFAQFYDGVFVHSNEIYKLDSKLKEADDAGLKNIPVKISGPIELRPLGNDWSYDSSYISVSPEPDADTDYTSRTFEIITKAILALQEKDYDVSVSIDLSGTDIDYLPYKAFTYKSDSAYSINEVILPKTCKALLPFSLAGTEIKNYTVPAHITDVSLKAFNTYFIESIDFEENSLCKNLCDYISGCHTLKSITIPAGAEQIPSGAFSGCSSLTTVTFQEGSSCKYIGSGSFSGCSKLSEITIPASVVSIPSGLFSGCTSLKNVTFEEESLCSSIGSGAFYRCINLETVAIPAEVTELNSGVFSDCYKLKSLTFESGSKCASIYVGALSNCRSLTAIQIPAEVTELNGGVFDGCTNLNSITFEEGSKCAYISSGVFTGNSLIKSIIIPASVTELSSSVFAGCTSLKSVTFEEGSLCSSIGSGAFSGCNALETFEIPAKVKTIPSHTFEGLKLKSVIFADESELETIESNAFYACTELEKLAIPESVTSIDKDAFIHSIKLKRLSCNINLAADAVSACTGDTGRSTENGFVIIKLSGELTDENKDEIFAGLKTALSQGDAGSVSLDLSDVSGLTAIPDDAFNYCIRLAEISLPESAAQIGNDAFATCEFLTSIHCTTNNAASVIAECVDGCAMGTKQQVLIVHVSGEAQTGFISGVKAAVAAHTGCEIILDLTGISGLTDEELSEFEANTKKVITLPEGETVEPDAFSNYIFLSTVNCDVTNAAAAIKACTGECSSAEKNTLTVKVTGTAGSSFISDINSTLSADGVCTINLDLSEVTGLTQIEEDAFTGTNTLESISLPASVTSIGAYAFYETYLKSVTFAEESQLTEIGEAAFCETSIQTITVPSSVMQIGERAFKDSGLNSITFEEESSLESIGNSAFENCTNLNTFIFGGTSTQWGNVARGEDWHNYVYTNYVTCLNKSVSLDYDGLVYVAFIIDVGHVINKTAHEGDTLKVVLDTFTEEDLYVPGYTITGWIDIKNGGIEFKQESTRTENGYLIASRHAIEYQITYELNGGTNSTDNPESYTVSYTAVFDEPYREGYLFCGWYDAKTGGNRITDTSDQIGDLTLYARWTQAAMEISVTIEPGSDLEIETLLPEEGDDENVIRLLADEGYTNYTWVIDGESVATFKGVSVTKNGRMLSIEADTLEEGGRYQISVSAMKGSVPHGAQITVTR